MTGGYRLVEKYENAYHFIVARRPAMGNTLQSKSPTFRIWYELNYNNNGE